MSSIKSTKSTIKELRDKIILNLDNLDDQIFLNNCMELVKSRIEKLNQLNFNFMNADELDDKLKSIFERLNDLIKKIIDLNEELDRKEALALVINESIIDLPIQFDKTIKEFQNDKSIIRLGDQFNKLTEEIRNSKIRQIVNEDLIKEALADQNTIESKKEHLNKQLTVLNSELDKLMSNLDNSEQLCDQQKNELSKIESSNLDAQTKLNELKNELLKMQNVKKTMLRELNEKLDLSTKLKKKRENLLNGTYLDDETQQLKMKIDAKNDELKRKLDLIEDVKAKSSTQTRSSNSIKQIKLKDANLTRDMRILLNRLNELISMNYRDHYLLFDDGFSQLK